jgi:hypothetical protein
MIPYPLYPYKDGKSRVAAVAKRTQHIVKSDVRRVTLSGCAWRGMLRGMR